MIGPASHKSHSSIPLIYNYRTQVPRPIGPWAGNKHDHMQQNRLFVAKLGDCDDGPTEAAIPLLVYHLMY
jgi:hypothetical protein